MTEETEHTEQACGDCEFFARQQRRSGIWQGDCLRPVLLPPWTCGLLSNNRRVEETDGVDCLLFEKRQRHYSISPRMIGEHAAMMRRSFLSMGDVTDESGKDNESCEKPE